MQAYRLETVIPQNGELRLKQLPFAPGEKVEVIVRLHSSLQSAINSFPLRNTVLKYEEPTEPVAANDWTALQ
jgi:hypothetical protein